jgi:hypothetical protein
MHYDDWNLWSTNPTYQTKLNSDYCSSISSSKQICLEQSQNWIYSTVKKICSAIPELVKTKCNSGYMPPRLSEAQTVRPQPDLADFQKAGYTEHM